MTDPTETTRETEAQRLQRGSDKTMVFRMAGAAFSTVSGLGLGFFHEYVSFLRDKGGAPHVGVDWGSLGYFLFCFLLVLLFLYKEVGGLAKWIVEGIRAARGQPPTTGG